MTEWLSIAHFAEGRQRSAEAGAEGVGDRGSVGDQHGHNRTNHSGLGEPEVARIADRQRRSVMSGIDPDFAVLAPEEQDKIFTKAYRRYYVERMPPPSSEDIALASLGHKEESRRPAHPAALAAGK
jgi:hypothetical protein